MLRGGEGAAFGLHDFNKVGVLAVELGEIDHHAGEEGLTGALGAGPQGPGEPQGDRGVRLPDLYRGAQAHHVVERALNEPDGAGDGGADDVLAGLGVAAVSHGVKAGDAAALRVEGDGGHSQALIVVISTLV